MAKILVNGEGENEKYTIAGLTRTEFFTLFNFVVRENRKASDPDNKEYNDNAARKVINLHTTFTDAFIGKITI